MVSDVVEESVVESVVSSEVVSEVVSEFSSVDVSDLASVEDCSAVVDAVIFAALLVVRLSPMVTVVLPASVPQTVVMLSRVLVYSVIAVF